MLASGTYREGIVSLIGAVPGLLQIIGLWTPIAALAAILTESWVLLVSGDRLEGGVLLILLNAAIAMLGPGCWSIDSVLFGRRRLDLNDR